MIGGIEDHQMYGRGEGIKQFASFIILPQGFFPR